VEEGSKPAWAGVRRALRFWIMLSSVDERDIRRKSLNSTVEKQNWGVRLGGEI